MELFSSALCLLLLALVCYVWWKSHDRKCMPSPSWWDTLRLINVNGVKPPKFCVDLGKKCGGVYAFNLYVRNFIVINDWTVMKQALVTQSAAFSGRPCMYVAEEMLQHTDILFIDGPLWFKKRNFTLHHLRNLGFGKTSMEAVILLEISKFAKFLERRNSEEPICINSLFYSPVINVLWGLLAGRPFDHTDVRIKKMGETISTVFQLFHDCLVLNIIPQLKFINFRVAQKKRLLELADVVKDFLREEIELNRKSLVEADPRCFFDIFLAEMIKQEATSPTSESIYTDDHLIGISFDILQAGIETTVSTLEWTLLYMALWPEIQKTAQDELDNVIGRHRQPTFADRCNLPFVEATILEIHRFSSVIPMSGPHCAMSSVKLCGYDVQRNTVIVQNIWAVHNDPKLWGDPKVFRPQRFINDLGKVEKPEYLIPFSLGPRKCLGESLARIELFLFIASMLQNFSISYVTGIPPPTLDEVTSVTRPPQEFSLIIRKRPPKFY